MQINPWLTAVRQCRSKAWQCRCLALGLAVPRPFFTASGSGLQQPNSVAHLLFFLGPVAASLSLFLAGPAQSLLLSLVLSTELEGGAVLLFCPTETAAVPLLPRACVSAREGRSWGCRVGAGGLLALASVPFPAAVVCSRGPAPSLCLLGAGAAAGAVLVGGCRCPAGRPVVPRRAWGAAPLTLPRQVLAPAAAPGAALAWPANSPPLLSFSVQGKKTNFKSFSPDL